MPNLKVTDFTTQISGNTIKLKYQLKAEGQLNGAFNMGVFIKKGPNGRWLRKWGLPSSLLDQLESGQTISQLWSFQIPDWGEGTYFISIHADVDNYISESSKDDNRREKRISVVY